jgi:hypothetical protein
MLSAKHLVDSARTAYETITRAQGLPGKGETVSAWKELWAKDSQSIAMTDTCSDTFNREDIRRVHASFAADYRIAAESTELHSCSFIDATITGIGVLAEE